jgi:hypothetical protein
VAHYKEFFDQSEWLFFHDLKGKDVTVTIEGVSQGVLIGDGNKKSKKPAVAFVGAKKRLALNKTNAKTIAAMYGSDTTNWVGKRITLYPTTTTFGRDTVECVRVRPSIPKGKDAPAELEPPAPEQVQP